MSVDEILDFIGQLTDEERTDFWSQYNEMYCLYCGKPHPPVRRCQCWNEDWSLRITGTGFDI